MTSDLSVITQAIVDLIKADEKQLKLHDVFYGDQELVPSVPAVTVEAGSKNRDYNATGLMTHVDITIYVMVYHGRVQDRQVTQKEIDQRVEAVEALLHEDNTLSGNVISGLVSAVDPGVAQKGRELFLATRLTWTAVVKERIGV